MIDFKLSETLRRNPLRITCGTVSVLAGLGIYLVQGWRSEAAGELEVKTAEGEKLAANVRNAAHLAEQLQTLSAVNADMHARMIRMSELATNLQYFYRLETESEVELVELRQTTTSESSTAKGPKLSPGVGFAVSVRGEYRSLLGWLRRLEGGPYFCRVLSVGAGAPIPDRAGPIVINVNVELLGKP